MAKAKARDGVTKTEAVRQVLGTLGDDAPADVAMAQVLEQFGHELSRAHYFNIKSTLRSGGKKRRRGRPARAAVVPSAASRPGPRNSAGPINLADLAALKSLVARYSKQDLHALVDLVSKRR